MDSIRAAQCISIPTAFVLAGYYICSSQNPASIIVHYPPNISTPIFSRIYTRGVSFVVPGTVAAAMTFGYLAYEAGSSTKRKYYAGSAALALAVLPWTTVVMMNGIKRLIEISNDSSMQASKETGAEVTQLLKAWKAQNYVRAGFALTAGMVGLVASL